MKLKKLLPLQSASSPLADRVLIENIPPPPPPRPPGDRNAGGIVVPGTSQVARQIAAEEIDAALDHYVITRVIKGGPECKSVKAGDSIMVARHHVFETKPDGVVRSFIKETDIIALME